MQQVRELRIYSLMKTGCFNTLKAKLIHHEDFKTRAEAKQVIFEYIEVFYNRVRRHSSNVYMSPVGYELLLDQIVYTKGFVDVAGKRSYEAR